MSTELLGQTLLCVGGIMMALGAIIAPIAYFMHRRAKKQLEHTLDEAYGPRQHR